MHMLSDEDGVHLKKSETYFPCLSALVDYYW